MINSAIWKVGITLLNIYETSIINKNLTIYVKKAVDFYEKITNG